MNIRNRTLFEENYFEQKGKGEPIVFIHGSYATTSAWKKMVETLSKTHHCILFKLPGHGGAPEPNDFSNPSIDTELNILAKVVNQLTDQPIHLVGHSYGGVVALSQALKGNLNIQQLTLFEPVAAWVLDACHDTNMKFQVDLFIQNYRHDVSNNVPFACGQVIDFWGGEGAFASLPDFIKESMETLVENNIRHWDLCTDITSSLKDIHNCQVPTRLVYGTQSNAVAHSIAKHLFNELPNSSVHVIQGASHFLVTSHVNECLVTLNTPIS